MSHQARHHAFHPYSSKRPHARHAQSHAHCSGRAPGVSARLRAASVARLIAAEQALPANPDAAALLLDGALNQMLAQWARGARLRSDRGVIDLRALDQHSPAIAWRLRLALQALGPEARLAHCWALLDLLTSSAPARARSGDAAFIRDTHDLKLHHDQRRKDDQSHVS